MFSSELEETFEKEPKTVPSLLYQLNYYKAQVQALKIYATVMEKNVKDALGEKVTIENEFKLVSKQKDFLEKLLEEETKKVKSKDDMIKSHENRIKELTEKLSVIVRYGEELRVMGVYSSLIPPRINEAEHFFIQAPLASNENCEIIQLPSSSQVAQQNVKQFDQNHEPCDENPEPCDENPEPCDENPEPCDENPEQGDENLENADKEPINNRTQTKKSVTTKNRKIKKNVPVHRRSLRSFNTLMNTRKTKKHSNVHQQVESTEDSHDESEETSRLSQCSINSVHNIVPVEGTNIEIETPEVLPCEENEQN